MKKGKNKEVEFIIFPTMKCILGSGRIICIMEKEHMASKTESSTKDNLTKGKDKAGANST